MVIDPAYIAAYVTAGVAAATAAAAAGSSMAIQKYGAEDDAFSA